MHMGLSPSIHIMKDIVYFHLSVSNGVDVTNDEDLKGLLAMICNNNKHKTMIRV